MIKFFLNSILVCSFFFASISQATLITSDLTEDSYITYKGIDFAWASRINAEKFYVNSSSYNELLDPTIHVGWDFATLAQLDMLTDLSGKELLKLFTRQDGTYIDAFEYWNTVYEEATDTNNILAREIKSHWSWSSPKNEVYDDLSSAEKMQQFLEIANTQLTDYETFYVRVSVVQGGNTNPVPEPSTLMIFALGLIALASKKKLFS
jgi:hypothetical protein